MELPIYLSYKKFYENYNIDFKWFVMFFTEANESDYKRALVERYEIAMDNVTLVENPEFNCLDTIASTNGCNLIYEIYNDIMVGNSSEFDTFKIKQRQITFRKILEFLALQVENATHSDLCGNDYFETKKVEISDIDTDLLKYLSENFTSTDKRFSDLTRYNQIYRFLNEGRDYNLEHRAYKKLIKDLFGFDYLNREISKVQTPKHLTQLETLALNYHNSQK